MTKKRLMAILLIMSVMTPLSCQAFSFDDFFEDFEDLFSGSEGGETRIINEVNVSANTGGNKAGSGETNEGESKSKVSIKNIVNGEEISPVDIESESGEIKVENKIVVNDNQATVTKKIETDSEQTEETSVVDLGEDSFEETSLEIDSGDESGEETEEIRENFEEENEEENKEETSPVKKWYLDFVEDLKSFFNKFINLII